MANIVDGRCSHITGIYIARTVSRSIIYITGHSSKIAFVIRPIYIYITHSISIAATHVDLIVVIRITQIRIIYATRVDIYTVSTPRTRAGKARTYTGSKGTSSVQIIRDWITIVAN